MNRSCVPLIVLTLAAWRAAFAPAAEPDRTPRVPPRQSPGSPPRYEFVERAIRVDGDAADWSGVAANTISGKEHLWIGEGMTARSWSGARDLSYRWRGAWSGNRLYFLFEVTDDKVVEPNRSASYLCDGIELLLDPANRGGRRVVVQDGRTDPFAKCDPKELMGHEIHVLPTAVPRVYLDHADQYAFDKPQTDRFRRQWSGQAAARKTEHGYLIELGLGVPGAGLKPGSRLGVEIGVCDDDGNGRENIMMWTATQGEFWMNMDNYGEVTLRAKPPLTANGARGNGTGEPPLVEWMAM